MVNANEIKNQNLSNPSGSDVYKTGYWNDTGEKVIE